MLSALTKKYKRVKVQILKDFPRFKLAKGEIAQVKPTVMINYLHRGNGAKYIMDDTKDINIELYEEFKKRRQMLKDEQLKLEQEEREQMEHQRKETEEAKLRIQAEKDKRKKDIHNAKEQIKKWNKKITVEDVKIPGLKLDE